jgi:hypothetical protein
MHAFQSPNPSQPPTKRSRKAAPRSQSRRHPYRTLAIEVSVKLMVNVALSTAAIAALTQLVPYHTAQEAKLQELQTTVQSTNERLNQTQAKFNRYFDPHQTKALMQEHSNRIDPNQRQIIWQPAPVNQSTAKATP